MGHREGISEIDVTISYKDGIIFIEAKYMAPVSLRTSNDPRRDQVIRYLDVGTWYHLNHPDGVKEFYFVLIMDTEKPPWILTRYRCNQNLERFSYLVKDDPSQFKGESTGALVQT